MALFAVGSVSLCIVLMVIITSLFHGFLDLYNGYWQYEFGQVKLVPAGEISDFSQAADYLESQPEIDYVRISTTSQGLLFLSNGNVKLITIKGIDLTREKRADQFSGGLFNINGASDRFELSEETEAKAETWLAAKLRQELTEEDKPAAIPCIMSVGLLGEVDPQTDKYDKTAISDEISQWKRPAFIFTAQSGNESDATLAKRKNIRCWPIDVIETGSNHLDEMVLYMPFESVIKEFGTDGRMLIVGKKGVSDSDLAQAVKKHWTTYALDVLGQDINTISQGGLSISSEQPWVKMFNREIQKQLATMQVILGFVCMIAAVLIFVIIMMLVIQKRRDIGIIRAVGTPWSSVLSLFINYGIMIGLSGTVLGLIIGIWAVNNIELLEGGLSALLGFKIWKSGSYGFSQIPNWVHYGSLWWIIISGICTAGLGAAIPAFKAARIQPAESLRFE